MTANLMNNSKMDLFKKLTYDELKKIKKIFILFIYLLFFLIIIIYLNLWL